MLMTTGRVFRAARGDWVPERFGVAVIHECEIAAVVGSRSLRTAPTAPGAVLTGESGCCCSIPYYPLHLGGLQIASAIPLRCVESPSRLSPDFGSSQSRGRYTE